MPRIKKLSSTWELEGENLEWFQMWIQYRRKRGIRTMDSTVRVYRAHWSKLARHMEQRGLRVQTVKERDLEICVRSSGANRRSSLVPSEASQVTQLRVFSEIFDMARRQAARCDNPAEAALTRRGRPGKVVREYVMPSGVERAMMNYLGDFPDARKVADFRAWVITNVAMGSGLKPVEIRHLEVSDVRWVSGSLGVREIAGVEVERSAGRQLTPVTTRAANALAMWLEHLASRGIVCGYLFRRRQSANSPIGTSTLYRTVREVVEGFMHRRAGLQLLRDTFIQQALDCVVVETDIKVLAEWIGVTNLEYLKQRYKNLRRARRQELGLPAFY